MARQRKVSETRKRVIRELLEEFKPKDAHELQDLLKDLMADTVQSMLEVEIDEELGYSKYDYQNRDTDNSRNRSYPKTVKTTTGEILLDIPRDKNGELDPKVVKKYENDLFSIEDKILSMYAKGVTTRNIKNYIQEISGFDTSPTLISKITDKIIPVAYQWQSRPLERLYALVYMDAVHFTTML